MNEKDNEPTELNEDELEGAAGGLLGIVDAYNCFFEPHSPVTGLWDGQRQRALCKSKCLGAGIISKMCRCHNTELCQSRYHVVDRHPDISGVAVPSPIDKYNHSESRKRVHGIWKD